jgi:hypothetical protein
MFEPYSIVIRFKYYTIFLATRYLKIINSSFTDVNMEKIEEDVFFIKSDLEVSPYLALWRPLGKGGPVDFTLSPNDDRKFMVYLVKFSSKSKIMPTGFKFNLFLPHSELSIHETLTGPFG